MVYADNPMHRGSTADNGMEARPLREWIAKRLPSLDAPSIFAVHQAFDIDGIHTFNDIVECVKGKVIDMSEIKSALRQLQDEAALEVKHEAALKRKMAELQKVAKAAQAEWRAVLKADAAAAKEAAEQAAREEAEKAAAAAQAKAERSAAAAERKAAAAKEKAEFEAKVAARQKQKNAK